MLRENADKIFAVTINGAQLGSNTWTEGLIQPLDRGDFDNRELLKTLRQIGYRGPIALMCYGVPDSGLTLDLVYNPQGPVLLQIAGQ